jgi:hypothetical protein
MCRTSYLHCPRCNRRTESTTYKCILKIAIEGMVRADRMPLQVLNDKLHQKCVAEEEESRKARGQEEVCTDCQMREFVEEEKREGRMGRGASWD